LIEDSLGNLKSATEQNISQTAHGLDKLYIRLMAFLWQYLRNFAKRKWFYLFEAGKNIERFYLLSQ
jgi:hypothetical protein